VIVHEAAGEHAAQVAFAQDEDVIEALAADRTDEPFREGVVPGARGRRQDFSDPHAPHLLSERVAVDRVAIAKDLRRAVSSGKASTIGWAVQYVVGCSVTL
jgi:hypothetical protein